MGGAPVATNPDSRAYYAVHHCVIELLEGAGVAPEKGPGAHKDVWLHLADCDDDELKRVSSELANLHSDRIKADYRLEDKRPEDAKRACQTVTQARELMDAVSACCADAARYAKVKAAIKAQNDRLRGLAAKK